MRTVTPCLAALLLAGCATAPEGIAPRETPHSHLLGLSCAELAERADALEPEIQRYVESQERARIADAVTWPVSTARLFGKNSRNVEAIARLRGELVAVNRARDEKACAAIPNGASFPKFQL